MKVIAAMLYATASAVLSAIALAFWRGHLDSKLAAVSLVAGACVGIFSIWAERRKPRELWKIDALGAAVIIAFALFAIRSFLWLVFESGDALWAFSANNLGDLPLHLTYIRYLANGAPFWPENPIFAGAPLTYPIGMDLFNSLLALLGVDVIRGLIAVGLAGGACAVGALWRWGRTFALAGFLFAGGTLGFLFFQRWQMLDYQSDIAYENLVVGWKSLPLALFVTQRGFLYALPAGLFLLASWRARFLEPERVAQRLPLWGEFLLYAAMPVFHLHTFLFLSFVAAWWFVAVERARTHLLLVISLSFVPATALVWLITGGFHGASMLGWKPGWMQDSPGYGNALAFWVQNFGILPLLVAWVVVKVIRDRGPGSAAHTLFPALTIFVLCCFVKFAPWEWDNTKLMIWSYLAILPALWECLLKRQREWVQAVACFFLFASGAISLAGGLAGRVVNETESDRDADGKPLIGYSIGIRSELVGVQEATRGLSITDRYLAHPNYNHPLLMTGHLLLMGYEGHVQSHGLSFRERLDAIQSILRGEEGWREKANSLGARWLFWGKQEEQNYGDSRQPWRETCRLQASGDWGELYDLTQAAVQPVR